MSRHEYFEKRLKELGMFDKDSDYEGMLGKAILRMSKVFAKEGHSGFSAVQTMKIFNMLMKEWDSPETHLGKQT